jgi:hypothetical protein
MDEPVDHLLKNLPSIDPPDDLKDRVLQSVAADRRRRALRWKLAYAGTVLALALGGFWLGAALADSYLPDLLPILLANWVYAGDLWSEIGASLMEGTILVPAAAVVVASLLIVVEVLKGMPVGARA